MDNDVKKLLKDILIRIDTVNSYTGLKKVFSEYNTDFLLQDAVERNLITIGEAMNLLLKKTPDISITNARKIVNTRNRLTHGYDEIDSTQIWNIIINYLPTLKTEVERLLAA
jgi:uncharacterized protein with HEPN domain